MADVRPARNGGLCRRYSLRLAFELVARRNLLREPGAGTPRPYARYREHSMATNSSVLVTPTGIAPVISSRSTLRKEAACVNSRERQ